MSRQIVVEIVGDASKFNTATGQAINSSATMSTSFKSAGVAGAALGIGAKVASLGVGLVIGAIETGVGKLGEAADAFRADEVSAAKLTQALKNNIPGWDGNTAGVEAYALAQEKLGFSDDEVRDSIGQLIGVTHDLSKAQELNSLAQDIARAKGIDLATATDAVNKAYNGQGRALKGLGIDIGDAKTATELLDAAQQNVKGSAEAWAATNEGKLAASNQKVSESMEKIGSVVSTVASVALPILADAFVAIVDVLGQVWDAIQPVISAIVDALTPVVKALLPVFQAVFGAIFAIVKALGPVFRAVFAVVGSVVGAIMAVVKALAPGFKIVFGILANIVGSWVKGLQAAFKVVATVIGVLQKVFQALGTFVGKVFSTIGSIVRGVINAIIGIVNSVIRAINRIQVHIHVGPVDLDFNGLNIPTIPRLHSGGVVPGSPGTEVLTILEAGETVTPRGGAPGGQTINIHIDSFIGSDSDIDRFANKVALRLRTA